MFVVTNRVPVAAPWRDEFEARFSNRVGRIDSQPGFVRMEVHRPLGAGEPYLVQTVWQSEQYFQSWVSSQDFKDAHANPLPKEAYNGESQMEKHEIVVST